MQFFNQSNLAVFNLFIPDSGKNVALHSNSRQGFFPLLIDFAL